MKIHVISCIFLGFKSGELVGKSKINPMIRKEQRERRRRRRRWQPMAECASTSWECSRLWGANSTSQTKRCLLWPQGYSNGRRLRRWKRKRRGWWNWLRLSNCDVVTVFIVGCKGGVLKLLVPLLMITNVGDSRQPEKSCKSESIFVRDGIPFRREL